MRSFISSFEMGKGGAYVKKGIGRSILILSPVAVLALLCVLAVFALPAQYSQTFVGALRDKLDLLNSVQEVPRIIVVGGSSVAFGQRSDLLEAELPDYQVVNFGLYAGLGTVSMLDLSLPDVRPGDVVILSPEQNRQTLSGYFGAETMWQAADGCFSLLTRLDSSRRREMLGEMLPFAADKAKLWLLDAQLKGDGVYSRSCLNAWGDISGEGRGGNVMPGGADPDMPILFDPALLEPAFVAEMNAYADVCRDRGARVYYRFCPMNASAITAEERARVGEYTAALEALLTFPVLGRAEDSILDQAWFFDTNFHLNDKGAIVNTIRLAGQLKQELGIPGDVAIAMPEAPEAMQFAAENPESTDAAYFTWEVSDGAIYLTGLTREGIGRTHLTIPSVVEGRPVTAFSARVFSGNEVLEEVVIPAGIRRIENGSFHGCTALERLVLQQDQPNQLSVGDGLLDGTGCVVVVPMASYGLYQTSYFWSIHSSRIRGDRAAQDTTAATAAPVQHIPAADMNMMYADANGGESMQGSDVRVPFAISKTHLRTNTPLGQKLFRREGYVPLCWNTAPDGSGQVIPFGSRVDSIGGGVLYMQWIPLGPEDAFRWVEENGAAHITAWTGTGGTIVIPSALGGMPVTCIKAGALKEAQADAVILPETLEVLEAGAFTGSSLKTLWLYDSLQEIDDGCFRDCDQLQTLYINAATPPRYTVSYFGAFADKLDWLRQVADEKKLVMFGGSASRYAYNSKELHAAFPSYQMVNMGVYAYTNALPQYRIIQQFMRPDDVLLSAPEFDTTETQFCKSNALDDCFWAMAEADYACAALLDLRQYTKVFRSLGAYLHNRQMMPERQYEESPKWYDDDGNPAFSDTYNVYGDYTLLRSGGGKDGMLMYYRADYTVKAFPVALIEALNGVYREFQARGVKVLFAYTPRNQSSLTAESTEQERRALHTHLAEHLAVPMILEMEQGLYPGTYFYLIDSHLNDEGVYIHTKRIINALRNLGLE